MNRENSFSYPSCAPEGGIRKGGIRATRVPPALLAISAAGLKPSGEEAKNSRIASHHCHDWWIRVSLSSPIARIVAPGDSSRTGEHLALQSVRNGTASC